MSAYEALAYKFLTDFGLDMKAAYQGYSCPPWCDGRCIHGDQYRITLKRHDGPSISFNFWNSLHDVKAGKSPDAYDVLACISGDVYCPETFADFCSEYGYDEDSRKAESVFKYASTFARKLRGFFSPREIERLSEIQ